MQNEKDKPIAYIAGALNDDACEYIQNLHKMIIWAEKIRQLGYAVFIPGTDFLHGLVCGNLNYEDYFENDYPFLKKSDIMFVCPGWENSKGTAKELRTAKKYNIPVYVGETGLKLLNELRRRVVKSSNEVVDEIIVNLFEDIYARYVVKEDRWQGNYIMATEEARCSLRSHAARFTKQRALEYIKHGHFCKNGGPFIIEDAV